MNKGELVKEVADKAKVSQKVAGEVLEAYIDAITAALKKGKKVQLIGFGTFELRAKAARTGVNPQTKKPVKIAACKAPAFKAGKAYKDLFNKKK